MVRCRYGKEYLEIIAEGIRISTGRDEMQFECEISLLRDGKCQIVEGYVFRNMPGLYGCNQDLPEFQIESLEDVLENDEMVSKFYESMDAIREDIFGKIGKCMNVSITSGSGTKGQYVISNLIRTESNHVCKDVVQQVDKM